MQRKQFTWFDTKTRQEQLDEHIRQEGRARFGSEQLEETAKAERVRRHFASVASRYDMMNTLLSFGVHYLWKHTGIRLAGLKPGDRVLDVCGGTGDLSVSSVKKVGPEGRVVLYDINREMILSGRDKKTNALARSRVNYVQGDAESISFPDNSFDVVLIGFAVRNITHMKQAFREMHRVLKPGGKFVCLEFSKPVWPWFRLLYDFYSFHIMPVLGDMIVGTRTAYLCLPETIRLFLTPEELAEVLRETGYKEVQYRRLTNGIAVVHTGVK